MVHGQPTPTTYHAPENVAHDPNLTIEVIQRTIKRLEAKRGGKLPRTLFLQLDNCTRENKNTAVMAYLSWLVERGVFDKIEVSFLPVGHTHNECDQVGSRYSIGVRHTTIGTREAMVEILEGHSGRVVCVRVSLSLCVYVCAGWGGEFPLGVTCHDRMHQPNASH